MMTARDPSQYAVSVLSAGRPPRRCMSTVALPRRGSPRCCNTTPTSQAASLPHVVTKDEMGRERYAGPVNASWGTGEGLSSGLLEGKEVESGGQQVGQAGDVEQGLRVIIHYDDEEEERRLIRKVHEGTCALGQVLLGSVFGFMMGSTSCLVLCSPSSAYAQCGAITMTCRKKHVWLSSRGVSCGLGVTAASGRFADLPPHMVLCVREFLCTCLPVLATAIATAGLCLHVLSRVLLLVGPLLLLLSSLSSSTAAYLLLHHLPCPSPSPSLCSTLKRLPALCSRAVDGQWLCGGSAVDGTLPGLTGQWWVLMMLWWHPGKPSSKSPHTHTSEHAKHRLL